jgi:hypothetical protein
MTAPSRTKTTCSATVAAQVALVVVIIGFDTAFNRISYSTRGHDRHVSHPLLLILAKRLVEWLPRIASASALVAREEK